LKEANAMRRTLLCIAAAALALTGCAGPRAFTKGTYEDPQTIALLDDRFSENDLQLIAKTMVNSLSAAPQVAGSATPPAVLVGKMRNRTTEHIDMESLADKIRTALVQSGKFRFVDGVNRTDIAEEYEYQQSGYVDPRQAKGPGGQTGADYLLTGTLTSNVQQVGKDKLVYYKATFQLTGLASSEIVWSEEKEIRKAYRKRSVGL
jgi:uncharacterized protein (TIGR02722 family)